MDIYSYIYIIHYIYVYIFGQISSFCITLFVYACLQADSLVLDNQLSCLFLEKANFYYQHSFFGYSSVCRFEAHELPSSNTSTSVAVVIVHFISRLSVGSDVMCIAFYICRRYNFIANPLIL